MLLDKVRLLKRRFRLAMNGVVSTSMRERGVIYKLNFGVSLPTLKKIAAEYCGDLELAEHLLSEGVRESLIVATLIYPLESFGVERARRLAETIEHLEIAEQASMNLFCKLPEAPHLVQEWMESEQEMIRTIGYLTLVRLLMAGFIPEEELLELLLEKLCSVVVRDENQAELHHAMNALKRLGRLGSEVRARILSRLAQKFEQGSRMVISELEAEYAYYEG